ncbi:hypothetical protein PVAP13_6KG296212 [Panicum virgatum]|uniref:Uncharacterized protein n=1 Tax=Panicum virgatum TaxID=38727 RepID=A0A8T0RH26_PANVG|nr:hypothetical protein PVAP13_6KG296212 [Panicum virgatum]
MSDSKIDHKHLSAACYEHFMRDQPPYPPDVKTLQDLSAFLRYKSLCLIDGEEPDPDVVDNNAFVGQLSHEATRRTMTMRSPAPCIERLSRLMLTTR